ncbi:hypothetical protein X798_07334 [Onchocerca flexuosa]|uniref:Uncharacterized protein n=1 Tax=Onchocerca flexuosa TaxID=387005 RepID=A0A238BM10_9BILA|nr:hypothetical protein X798_07334 [Onchocerca flexuosa]
MLRDVDEIPDNVCGVIGNRYVIAGPVDEPIEKAFMHFHLYDSDPKGEKKQVAVVVDTLIIVTTVVCDDWKTCRIPWTDTYVH